MLHLGFHSLKVVAYAEANADDYVLLFPYGVPIVDSWHYVAEQLPERTAIRIGELWAAGDVVVCDGAALLEERGLATVQSLGEPTPAPAQREPEPPARRMWRSGRAATVLALAASLLLLGVVTIPTSDGGGLDRAHAGPTFAAQWSDFATAWQLDCRDVTPDAARCYRVRKDGTTARFSVLASRRPDGNTYSIAGGTGALLTLHTFHVDGGLDDFCETLHVLPPESLRRIVVDDRGLWAIVVDDDKRAERILAKHEGSLTAAQWHERHGAVHGPHDGHGAF